MADIFDELKRMVELFEKKASAAGLASKTRNMLHITQIAHEATAEAHRQDAVDLKNLIEEFED